MDWNGYPPDRSVRFHWVVFHVDKLEEDEAPPEKLPAEWCDGGGLWSVLDGSPEQSMTPSKFIPLFDYVGPIVDSPTQDVIKAHWRP